jgi:hypothetical protein
MANINVFHILLLLFILRSKQLWLVAADKLGNGASSQARRTGNVIYMIFNLLRRKYVPNVA